MERALASVQLVDEVRRQGHGRCPDATGGLIPFTYLRGGVLSVGVQIQPPLAKCLNRTTTEYRGK